MEIGEIIQQFLNSLDYVLSFQLSVGEILRYASQFLWLAALILIFLPITMKFVIFMLSVIGLICIIAYTLSSGGADPARLKQSQQQQSEQQRTQQPPEPPESKVVTARRLNAAKIEKLRKYKNEKSKITTSTQ